jgi:hypothetical protein
MDVIVLKFLAKAQENFALYENLKEQDKFHNWQIVALFYSALCYAKAYLYNKNIPENSINSHDSIRKWLSVEKDAKISNVLRFYEPLYRDSRDARYTTKKISIQRINRTLENYNKVKELLHAS